MAKRAMLKFKVIKLAFKSFMLACLALVELFSENALSRSDARRKVTSAFFAVDIAKTLQIYG